MLVASVEGLEAITIGGVAARASLPKSTVQTLFADRAALQIAALDRGVRRFEDYLREAGDLPAAPLDRLARVLDTWLSFVAGRHLPGGCLISSSLMEYRARTGPLKSAVLAQAERWKSIVLDLLDEATARGDLAGGTDVLAVFHDIRSVQLAANVAACLSDADGVSHARIRFKDIVERVRA